MWILEQRAVTNKKKILPKRGPGEHACVMKLSKKSQDQLMFQKRESGRVSFDLAAVTAGSGSELRTRTSLSFGYASASNRGIEAGGGRIEIFRAKSEFKCRKSQQQKGGKSKKKQSRTKEIHGGQHTFASCQTVVEFR